MYSRREFAFLFATALPKDKPAGGPGKPFLEVIRLSTNESGLQARCSQIAKRGSKDPLLAAYTISTPAWKQHWVEEVRKLHAEHELKDLYIQFLKETYGYQVQTLAEAYGLETSSFTELASRNWRDVDPHKPQIRKDDETFLGWMAESLFSAAVAGIKSEDRAHPVVSPLLDAGTPDGVLKAANTAFDVLWLGPGIKAPGGRKVVRWSNG